MSLTVETDLDLAGSFRADAAQPGQPPARLGPARPGQDGRDPPRLRHGPGAGVPRRGRGDRAVVPGGRRADRAVSGYDKSYKMRRAQPEPTEYTFMNDSVIAAQIAALNGLIPVVDPAPGLPSKTVQVESDMAFLKSRRRALLLRRLRGVGPAALPASASADRRVRAGVGDEPVHFHPRISAAGLAGLQVIRGYNQELAQTITVATLAADLDLDNLLERLGSSALRAAGLVGPQGCPRQPVENPLDATVLAQSLLSNLLEGLYEGTGSCIGLPGLRAGQFVEVRGRGQAVQRHVSGPEGDAPHRQWRVRHQLRHQSARPHQPARPAAQAGRRRTAARTGGSRSTGCWSAGSRTTTSCGRCRRPRRSAG